MPMGTNVDPNGGGPCTFFWSFQSGALGADNVVTRSQANRRNTQFERKQRRHGVHFRGVFFSFDVTQ